MNTKATFLHFPLLEPQVRSFFIVILLSFYFPSPALVSITIFPTAFSFLGQSGHICDHKRAAGVVCQHERALQHLSALHTNGFREYKNSTKQPQPLGYRTMWLLNGLKNKIKNSCSLNVVRTLSKICYY